MKPATTSSSLREIVVKQLSVAYYNGLDKKGWSDYEESVSFDAILSAISQYTDRQISLAKLEILRGFLRRDFVNPDLYETAILDRITELQANTEPPIS